jgi:hypothetical protein
VNDLVWIGLESEVILYWEIGQLILQHQQQQGWGLNDIAYLKKSENL